MKRHKSPKGSRIRRAHDMRALAASILLLTLFSFSALACGPNDIQNVDAKELKNMIGSVPNLLVVDTRSEAEYREGHIPGAILISQEKASIVERFLPENKDTVIVFYCRGAG